MARSNPNTEANIKNEPTVEMPRDGKQPKNTNTPLNLAVHLFYLGHDVGIPKSFAVSPGMQTFTEDYIFQASPSPLLAVRVNCFLPYSEYPEFDLRSIWVTGFELIALN